MAEERFGPLYLMVNNAGIMGAMGYMDDMGLPEFEATLAVNLTSVFLGSKHAIRCGVQVAADRQASRRAPHSPRHFSTMWQGRQSVARSHSTYAKWLWQ